jgi:uncharacterized protein
MMADDVQVLAGGGGAVGENRLAGSISPYLQQHAGNPVHWYPWGEEAFARARHENKPIFLSVGYSTCHWCHVMNRESFGNEAIAAVLNAHFIPIKVDREERPDIDRVYMTFVTASTGSGGWPLSVWLTPELKPFAGGTYYPPEDRWGRPGFRSILEQIARAWQEDRAGIVQAGEQVVAQLRRAAATKYQASLALDAGLLEKAYANLQGTYEPLHGGFSAAPKFPRPSSPGFLLRYHAKTGAEDALSMTLHTLRRMAEGGMYDQVGGGFHRYAVDTRWHVPHFEKMLYDQALLVPLYLEAYQLTGDPFLARIVREVLAYVARDLTGPAGQFYSAEDADSPRPDDPSVHAEGAFHVWQASEFDAVLGDEAPWARQYFGVEDDGNVYDDPHDAFGNGNILYIATPLQRAGEQDDVDQELLRKRRDGVRARLLEARARRPRPHRDEKAITAWNALMISAYARAAQVLGDAAYLASAQRALTFIRENLYDQVDGMLRRLYRDGSVSGQGFLEDYAFLIQALLDLYEADFDATKLTWAIELQAKQDALFADQEGGYFDTVADAPGVLLRMKDDHDGAVPSGNSVSAMNLLRLSEMTANASYRAAAERTVRAFSRSLSHVPHAMPQMLSAIDFLLGETRQILIAGEPGAADTEALLRVVHGPYLPNRIIMLTQCSGGSDVGTIQPFLRSLEPIENRATAYVCLNHQCDFPVSTPEALAGILRAE